MSLLTEDAKGVFVISVTPFHPDGTIDFDSLDRVTDFYIEKGATGLTILGMMGEAPKLTQAESRAVAQRVIARAGDLPVVVGVSAPGLAAISELSKSVMDLGAAGVMIAPPGSLKTDAQIAGYYSQACAAAGEGVPVVLQDFPLSTGVQIDPAVLNRIVQELPQVVMLKHEDWPGLPKITALRRAEAAGQRRISILCGNGGIFLPEEMGRGADGAMTGFAFPEMLRQVVDLSNAGDMDRAQDIFDAYLPLVRYEQQPGAGLAVRKYVLQKRGAIASAALRSPGAPAAPEAIAEVDRLIARLTRRLKELT
ncbi:dihydrodipicolinate synthase family protein [Pseudooceanicola sp. GBMRC 2024]|uniref:Dihydrodipicolinate synthase family protein n=1 Tax=Pseudooceanicola albus TaxID=2692189 RepID=A0A6L7G119_9RHOB|nr:dihydrodipicolinate synthase family protein [Pseudooceanicola albus]MXN17755.1 dihydrodipicolinate synthase family protein [Pseudooceanicola albus]